jgi:hypothetical protein
MDREFQITIGTHPSSKISLEQDVRLTKAALLYAGQVRLYSLTASMMLMILKLGDINPRQQLRFMEMTIPFLASEEEARRTLTQLKRIKNLRFKGRQGRVLLGQFEQLLAEQWTAVKEKAVEIAQEAGIRSIDRAVESGLLELHTFKGTDSIDRALEFATDCIASASGSPLLESRASAMSKRDNRMIREFVERISDAVSDGSTYPLFDVETSELVEASIREGKITVSKAGIERGKHSGLAGHLLQRLPLFEQASIDEILDIRRELNRYLTRFRKAIIEFSEAIKTESWDKDFPSEADKVFYRDVAPAVLDIEEAVKSNKYLMSLARKFADKPLILPSGAVLSVVMSQLSALPAGIVQGLGITTASALIVYDTYNEWKQKKQAIERNYLYFYYHTGKRLESQR